jgi:small-conductance mechanosensitive channel
VIAPIDFGRLEIALASSRGWLELFAMLSCIALAWALDRHIEARRTRKGIELRLAGSFVRLAFPLIALALVYVASFAWRRYVGPPFFLAIGMPILVALAVIRLIAYALRRLFPSQAWLPGWEVAISTTVWGLAVLYFLGVLPEMAEALDELTIPIGKSHLSLLTIFKGVAVVIVTLVLTLWVSGLIEQRLTRTTHLDANLRAVLAKSIKAVLIVIGVLIALEQIGFDLTLLTVFGGALGVGIGLGLQKLASNYIAGFTILLDRSIRLGDLITVDNKTGVVGRVTARYVVVRGGDGLEAIVPNETLVTTTVLNHSYTSTEIRIAIQVQVSYDSDVDKALALLLDVAAREPQVLREERPPAALVLALNDNGVALELGVWISDPHIQGGLRSSLYRGVLRAFAENGIRIPAPRRDVRIEATATASNDRAREAAGGPQPGDVPPTAMPS